MPKTSKQPARRPVKRSTIKRGSLVTIAWDDAKDTKALVVAFNRRRGDVEVMHEKRLRRSLFTTDHVDYGQIMKVEPGLPSFA